MLFNIDWCHQINRSDTESHAEVNKSEKRKYLNINLNSFNKLFPKRSDKTEQPPHKPDIEEGKLSEDENAAPSESTVIVEDEPNKRVNKSIPP